MREHYTQDRQSYPLADVALAIVIGFCLAMLLVTWWSA